MKTVVIHGPQGCGKTFHARALARHFGCTSILDGWDGCGGLAPGTLALTSATVIDPPARAEVLSFDVAMQRAGLKRLVFLSAETMPVVIEDV
ncbi:AAA family ATPase [Pseudothauera nasutitermitis]|uniref:AAA family ATPase n=1 Tax=Pseudothauera nasutitermitis TaxID=2565930 RepID=A0A4S4AP31_9RHOO|nr:AAA family ATPase [Pseudothauera nasutitermitis]THF61418.1 AAA family ATPase [Pseudothauera nasutitermitis]